MLIITLLLLLGNVGGAPTLSPDLLHRQEQPGPCFSQSGDQRSLFDVLWSCLATIIACTWVAIHPNIPDPKSTWWGIQRGRTKMAFYASMFPEVIILWAMRQWAYAQYLETPKVPKDYPEWTKTHAFFVQMGGFVLVDEDNKVLRVLKMEDILELSKNGTIDFPRISQKEIEDKSKGDLISKGIAIGQTMWFILQCAARKMEGLVITELELVTLGFAALNATTYILWWNKPLNVCCPFHIRLKAPNPCDRTGAESCNGSLEKATKEGPDHAATESKKGALRKRISGFWMITVVRPFLAFAKPLYDMLRQEEIITGSATVPTYHAGRFEGSVRFTVVPISSVIGMLFGGIHCLAWSFPFPTNLERLLWRMASVTTMAIPFIVLLFCIIHLAETVATLGFVLQDIGKVIGVLAFYIGPCIYLVARLDLLTQAFISLRSLPPLALQNVQWTAFVPHI